MVENAECLLDVDAVKSFGQVLGEDGEVSVAVLSDGVVEPGMEVGSVASRYATYHVGREPRVRPSVELTDEGGCPHAPTDACEADGSGTPRWFGQ